jgi:ankyrin repeat protein
MEAASIGRSDVTEILLERTADKEAKDRALFAAIVTAPVMMNIAGPQPGTRPSAAAPPSQISDLPYDASHTVNLLLENGADIEARDEQDRTPLIRAATYGQGRIVELLLDKGANIEARDPNGATALINAACGGCVVIDMGDTFDCVQLLIDRGANVEAKTKGGGTALMVAANYGQNRILKLLLGKGADVTDRDSEGSTALILAALSGVTTATGMVFTTDNVRLLLDHHSEVNARNKKGETALIAAVSEPGAPEATKIVRLLLNRGADASIKNIHGNTALTLAKKNGYVQAVDLLRKAAGNAG